MCQARSRPVNSGAVGLPTSPATASPAVRRTRLAQQAHCGASHKVLLPFSVHRPRCGHDIGWRRASRGAVRASSMLPSCAIGSRMNPPAEPGATGSATRDITASARRSSLSSVIVHPGLPGPGHAPASVFALGFGLVSSDGRRSGCITLAGLRLTSQGFRSTPSSCGSSERKFHGACAVTSFIRAAFRSPCVPAWLGRGLSASAALMGFSLRRFGPVRGWRDVSIPPRPPAVDLEAVRPVIFAGDRLGLLTHPRAENDDQGRLETWLLGFRPAGKCVVRHRPFAGAIGSRSCLGLCLSQGLQPPYGAPPDGSDSPAIVRPPAPALPASGRYPPEFISPSASVVECQLTT
jgi:hypothetical protein